MHSKEMSEARKGPASKSAGRQVSGRQSAVGGLAVGSPQSPVPLEAVLRSLKQGLGQVYGSRLRGLVLFGSYARGEADADSDVDVALVLDDFNDVWAEIQRFGGLVSKLCLRFGVLVTLYPIREEEWRTEKSPILLNVRREGVPIL